MITSAEINKSYNIEWFVFASLFWVFTRIVLDISLSVAFMSFAIVGFFSVLTYHVFFWKCVKMYYPEDFQVLFVKPNPRESFVYMFFWFLALGWEIFIFVFVS